MRKPVMHSIWLVLVLSILSSSVRAGTLGDLTYAINNPGSGILITNCNDDAEGEVVIPAEIEGLPVISITGTGFGNCSRLTSITIPQGVSFIGNGAFQNCSSLTSISIPDSVTSIEDEAFSRCSSLTSITIPEGVTRIGNYTFSGCSSLTSIIIPDSVTSIGVDAFYGCINLTSIIIPEGVTRIGFEAFYGCINLTSIIIPEGVTSIGDWAFIGCEGLTSITIPNRFHSRSEANRLALNRQYPKYFFPYPSPRRATATPVLANGFLVEAQITDQGARYTEAPAVTITGGGGSGAEAVAVVDDWHVVSIEIINPGRGYTSAPIITIGAPPEIPSSQVSLRMVPAITVTGEFGQTETIEVADNANGPWSEWRTVTIGEQGTTEVDLDEGAEKRFYRVRE